MSGDNIDPTMGTLAPSSIDAPSGARTSLPASRVIDGKRWVPMRLRRDDELGSFPGHEVPRSRNLSALAGLGGGQAGARKIVEANGARFTSSDIEGPGGMLERAGSRTLRAPGKYATDEHTVLLLPEGTPRTPALPSKPIPKSNAGAFVVGALVIGALIYAAS